MKTTKTIIYLKEDVEGGTTALESQIIGDTPTESMIEHVVNILLRGKKIRNLDIER